jgi:hypothetical protein
MAALSHFSCSIQQDEKNSRLFIRQFWLSHHKWMQLYQTDENLPGGGEFRAATQEVIGFLAREKWNEYSD